MAFRCDRWTLINVLPVGFVWVILGTIWSLYSLLHLLPQITSEKPDIKQNGIIEAIVCNSLTFMVVTCLVLAMFTDPGSVPDAPPWQAQNEEDDKTSTGKNQTGTGTQVVQHETKLSGARRWCKNCSLYKPDRCHHCRVCKSCILKMDHHCPWIANCIGFNNHKYFLLLVFYALVNLAFISFTLCYETVSLVYVVEMTFWRRFFLVFVITFSLIMGMLLKCFFLLHLWLTSRGMTTIEFCEKRHVHLGSGGRLSLYDVGLYKNLQSVLGPNPLFWLMPFNLPEGDGLEFRVGAKSATEPLVDMALRNQGITVRTSNNYENEVDSPTTRNPAPEVTGQPAAAD